MKKNSTMRLAVLLLALTLITSCFVGGTFAKYTAGATITDTSAQVAKWSFEVGGNNIAGNPSTQAVTIDLFDTAKTYEEDGTAIDSDVVQGRIAPGTGGEFELVLKNSSEVTAKYTIDYTVTASEIPLEFSVDGVTWDELKDVSETTLAIGASQTITVQWRWAFEQTDDVAAGDAADNALGTATTPATATVEVVLKAEQVD